MSLAEQIAAAGGLRLRYQPMFRLGPGALLRCEGIECLTRGPVDSPVAEPRELFRAARYQGVIPWLDRTILATALDELTAAHADLHLSFNVDVETLETDGDFPAYFLAALREHGIEPEATTVEVVEAAPVGAPARLARGVHLLRREGVRIALDDVGQGFANHRMLLLLRPDLLKLDRYVVRGVASDRHRRALASSVLHLARGIGGELVAEGVETEGQLDALRLLGVELFQGFLLGRPSTLDELRGHGLLDTALSHTATG